MSERSRRRGRGSFEGLDGVCLVVVVFNTRYR